MNKMINRKVMNAVKIIFVSLLGILLFSCQKEDGDITSPYVDMNTTDYLRANQFGIFSMSLELYEEAGLLDLLDKKGVTVFMPTNYSIKHYMKQREYILQTETGDETLEYTFDDLKADLPEFKDSLKMYIVEQQVNRSDLEGIKGESMIVKNMLGCDMCISLKPTKLYTENVPNAVNKYLYYTYIINGLDEGDNVPVDDKDVSNYCQTSGLITNTGILHVMRDEHPLFFNRYTYK